MSANSDYSELKDWGGEQTPCSAKVAPQWGRIVGPRCSRAAETIVYGRPLCWQHGRIASQQARWEEEDRSMEEIRDTAPSYPQPRRARLFDYRLVGGSTCAYCRRRADARTLVVNPISLQRTYELLCGRRRCRQKLRDWEMNAGTRRERAVWDWQREHLAPVPPAVLADGMRPQYRSISRATLREFLDSGVDAATVLTPGISAVTLNGSIKTLGFEAEVFAEVRDGTTTLRRVAS